MQRKALVFGAGLLLAIASIVPAQAALAAPAATVPPPRSVSVTGDTGSGDGATVHWAAPVLPRGSRLTGYTVTISPAEQQPDHGVDRLSARTTSDRFGYLTAGTTYSFAVRAVTNQGTSAAVTVTYVRPKPHAESLYALSSAGAVVATPVAGGPLTTVATGVASFDADQAGNVYAIPTAGTSIVKYPTTGGSPSTVVSGLSGVSHLQIDSAGRFYVDRAGSVERIAVTNGRVTTTVLGPSGDVRDVSGAGIVTTATASSTFGRTDLVQYPASAGTTVRFSVYGGPNALLVDANGGIYLKTISTGASGARTWGYYTPAGSTDGNPTASTGTTIDHTVGALSAKGTFEVVEATKWCAAPSTVSIPGHPATCADDLSAARLWARTITGATSVVAVSGFSLGADAVARSADVGAADSSGDLFAAVPDGPTPGLWEVPGAGGTATRIATGQYSNLVVG